MQLKKINIYTGNHGEEYGIEDYLLILQKVLERKGCSYSISTHYEPSVPNIVIDEFTNYLENQKLSEFRKNNPDTPIILVLTEFMQRKWGVKALNHFAGIGDSALICLINVFSLIKRKDFPVPRLKDWLLLVSFSPILFVMGIAHGIQYLFIRLFSAERASQKKQAFNARVYQLAYWSLRYHGLMRNLLDFDYILSSHEAVWPQMVKNGVVKEQDKRYVGVIYPEFDITSVLDHLLVNKQSKIEITGTITPYRKKWTNKINFHILNHGLHHTIKMVEHIRWGVETQGRRAAFSLHPPQTARWPYSSPTRIYRALQVDGNLPVLTRYFGQNPIEDICLIYHDVDTLVRMVKYWSDHESARHYIACRMDKYNAIAISKNDAVIKQILVSV